MERRLYFILGDLLSNAVLAALATWTASLLPTTWPMLVEMTVGMVVGMVAAMMALPLFMGLFGAMEVMVPVMLGSMCAGMIPSMAPGMREDPTSLLAWGAVTGVACWLFTLLVHFFVHGEKVHG